MKSNPSAQNREGIRLKVLWPLALVMVLILVAVAIIHSHSRSAAKPQPEESAATASSNAASMSREPAPVPHRPPRILQVETEPETARLISLMLEQSTTQQVRRQSARSLAKIGSDEAMAALKSALTNDVPPYVKAAIAEGLGQSPNPESTDLLHQLVTGKDEVTARGAVRGLTIRGDADAANTLGSLLFNDQTPLSVRTEAALDLGDVELPAARDLLTRAVGEIHDDDVRESALDGLGRRPFSETEDFFRNYLNSPTVPAEAKVLAIEAVRDADGDVAPFLSNYLNDANPDVRAAAKDALDFLGPTASTPAIQK